MSPKPFTTSQYDDPDPRNELEWCQDCQRHHWAGLGHVCDGLAPARGILNAVVCMIVILAALAGAILIWTQTADARTNQVHPIAAPQSLLKAREACGNHDTPVTCRAALRHAYDAIEWQRHARLHQGAYGVQHALRLASALYGVPMRELVRVGTCESHLTPSSKNRTSTASGLFQFLDSTWNRAGIPGFSVFDPYANAIAAARLVTTDGSWREWSCQP